mgnify:CR=1 FL=1
MSEYIDFFSNIKNIIVDSLNSLPSEISALLITCITLILAFFIYKFIR